MIFDSKCPFCGSSVTVKKTPVTFFKCSKNRCGALVSFGGSKRLINGFYEAENPERNFKRRSK